ncbi:MAG: SUMF1/EgtB/PvdO family nonheme iron enzyme [Gammaproteobacteria bacterium]
MTREALIEELARTHRLLLGLTEDADESTLRSQYHPDLSPLGWHLGHCVFVECLWLQEWMHGDDSVTAPIADLYTPPHTPKPERGRRLPPKDALLGWAAELQGLNRECLRSGRRHPLLEDDYIVHFLIQHHSQHYETMLMVLTQKAIAGPPSGAASAARLEPAALRRQTAGVAAGHYRIGGRRPVACDNELPRRRAHLDSYAIARYPASNAEYLGFIEDGGYRRETLWDREGWRWRRDRLIEHPDHWRRSDDGVWYGTGMRGHYPLSADQPVAGISHYEARAFAAWAGARLAHEYQWEVAQRLGLLEQTGRVWEWCENRFHPYPGFRPFPYPEYSQPWFDGRHYSLRGGSVHTRPAVRRASFRNFFEADKRHIFAGLRLVFPEAAHA